METSKQMKARLEQLKPRYQLFYDKWKSGVSAQTYDDVLRCAKALNAARDYFRQYKKHETGESLFDQYAGWCEADLVRFGY